MKFKSILAVLLALSLTSCYTVPPGYRGLKVSLSGDEKGGIQSLPSGRYFPEFNVEFYKFPTFQQNVVWTQSNTEGSPNDDSVTFQTSEGLAVNADVGFSYAVREDSVVEIFKKHRKGIENITAVYLRNVIRDAFNTVASAMTVEEIYGKSKSEFLLKVNQKVKDTVSKSGFEVAQISIIGTMRLPEAVLTALNNKIAATQRAQQRENELREAEAQAKKRLIEVRAEAEANRLKIKQLTPELLEYERIQNQSKFIEQWKGVLPTVIQGGNSASLFDVSNFMK